MDKEIVIKHSLLGHFSLFIICGIFTAVGVLMILDDKTFIGIASIALFGGGGLSYFVLQAGKPIVVISSEGITTHYGRKKIFVAWENVNRFEVVVQIIRAPYKYKQKYIGIFVNNKEDLAGPGEFLHKMAKGLTGWDEVPDILINLSFSFVKIEKVMGILQEFHDQYKNSQSV